MTGEADTQEQAIDWALADIQETVSKMLLKKRIAELIERAVLDARIELLNKLIKDEEFVGTASNADHLYDFDSTEWAIDQLEALEKERNLLT